jgi:hypothetical protein
VVLAAQVCRSEYEMKKPMEVIQPIDAQPAPKKRAGDLAYSIEEFCRRHSMSRSTYYELKAKGDGPREGHVLSRILITKEEAKEWRRKISAD